MSRMRVVAIVGAAATLALAVATGWRVTEASGDLLLGLLAGLAWFALAFVGAASVWCLVGLRSQQRRLAGLERELTSLRKEARSSRRFAQRIDSRVRAVKDEVLAQREPVALAAVALDDLRRRSASSE